MKNPSCESVQLVLTIEITSFSYKSALPSHMFSDEEGRHGGGFVFDCRSLPNPGREEKFKLSTGRDQAVITYLETRNEVTAFRSYAFALIDSAVANFLERGFEFMNVSFGCTGGQHRSVYLTEALATHLAERFGKKVRPIVRHPSLVAKGLLL